jgi:hypothetical protein
MFCECLPTCAPPYARRTLRQAETICAVTLAVGGTVGERVLEQWAMPTSHETLLRLIRCPPQGAQDATGLGRR